MGSIVLVVLCRTIVLILLMLTLNSTKNVTQLITRIEVRIMRLRREKGDRIKGALQATRDPNVPNNNTGITLLVLV